MRTKSNSLKLIYTILGCALLSSQASALEIKLPGITVNDDGVQVGDIKVTDDEVKVGSIEVTADQVKVGETVQVTPSEVMLSGVVLTGQDYSRATFEGNNLSGAELLNADFSRANFNGANLRGAIFENSDFSRATFVGACLEGAQFLNSDFTRADFDTAVMTSSVNSHSNFHRASMSGVDNSASCGGIMNVRAEVTSSNDILSALISGVDSRVDLTVNFAVDSHDVQGKAHEQIYEIADALNSEVLAGKSILIEGHTDSSGNNKYNVDLSYRRALQVKRILVEQYDIDRDQLRIQGFGESAPVASNETKLGRMENRRVTLVNLGS